MKPLPRPSFLRRQLPVAMILLIGSAFSVLLFQMKEEAVRERRRSILPERAHQHSLNFEWEIEAHLDAISGLRDFVLASPELDRTSFSSFAKGTLERNRALQTVLWLPHVLAEQRPEVELRAATDGFEGFTILTLDEGGHAIASPARESYYPVLFTEPLDTKSALFGLDYASQPDWNQLFQRALETGKTVAGTPFHAGLFNRPNEGIIPFVAPVLSKDGSDRGRPLGFLVAELDLAEIIRSSFQNPELQLLVTVFDVTISENPVSLYATGSEKDTGENASSAELLHTIGGRDWLIRVDKGTSAETDPSIESWSLLAGGLIFTGFVAVWVRQRQNYVTTIEKRVHNRTSALSRINEDLQKEMMQRRQAEHELQESETRFREAFWHAPTGCGLLSPKGKWIQVNEALMRITGYSEDELLTKTLDDLLPTDVSKNEPVALTKKLAGSEESFNLEERFCHKNGTAIDVLINAAPVRDSENVLLYFIIHIVDITKQTQALKETRAAKEFSESIIRSSIDGIFAFNLEKRVTVWNSGMEEMTGISAKEAYGEPLDKVLPFLAENDADQPLMRILAGGVVRAAERPFEVPSSQRRGYFAGNYAPLDDGSGAIIGGVAVVRDVTKQRESRQRLRAFTDLLKQRNRELQEFAYVASHDLQEPLRKILAFGDRLEKKAADRLDEQSLDYLDRMRNASRRMQTLINDLLTFSRVSTDANPFAEVELKTIAEEVLIDLENQIDETGASIEIGELPVIEADPTQMRQLLQNLISNGLKYRKPGTAPRIQIFARLHAAEENLPPLRGTASLLYVIDDGIGFEEKYIDRIFTVFQRLHGRNEYPGTGVGLAICRKIAERHNGWITAQSIPGEGSTFIVGLPHKQRIDS